MYLLPPLYFAALSAAMLTSTYCNALHDAECPDDSRIQAFIHQYYYSLVYGYAQPFKSKGYTSPMPYAGGFQPPQQYTPHVPSQLGLKHPSSLHTYNCWKFDENSIFHVGDCWKICENSIFHKYRKMIFSYFGLEINMIK
ncbi:hypothetical protein Hanom_Chr16g01434941 [Helianthus anomalus]